MERLRRYDIYAPVAKSDKAFEFGDAYAHGAGVFDAFEPRWRAGTTRLGRGPPRQRSAQGQAGRRILRFHQPGEHTLRLDELHARARDVATLAHELGHAIHAMLASHHSTFTFHSSPPLAETASTFGEMILTEKLLAEETDEAVRRDILFK